MPELKEFPLVSINCLSWNDKKTIFKALSSAANQTYPNLEIFIIDNNSTDGTGQELQQKIISLKKKREESLQKNYPEKNWPAEIKIIKNSENRGFAPGHNQLIHASKGTFVLCLNSDAILEPGYISQAIKIFIEYPEVGAIQGKLLRYNFEKNEPCKHKEKPSANIIDTTGLIMLKNRRIIARGQGEVDQNQFEKSIEIFGADGAAPIYRRAALEDIKLQILNQPNNAYTDEYFDEDFYLYKEDVDLAWRLRLYGWKTIYLPSAVAWHGRGAGDSATHSYKKIILERKKINPRAKYYSFKNQRLMQIKNEIPIILLRHLPQFLFKEIGAWVYIIFFERYTIKIIKELLKQMPMAFKKRRIIMARRRVSAKEIIIWFK